MYDVKKDAYSGVNLANISSMNKDELVEKGDSLKSGSEEQIKAGLNLWMMALEKDPTDAELINKITSYQEMIGDDAGALNNYKTGIKLIEKKGNCDEKALGNLYLGKAQLEIYSRENKDYEQAKKDLDTSAKLKDMEVDQSLIIAIQEGIAREKRRKNKA
ncbi:MAG: hypothetical protein KAI51_01675 [Candidatus Aenigmarchaeota archaeon]|nr:hypothetical protein [Candidatus Aenigmarchaeota archaeon]